MTYLREVVIDGEQHVDRDGGLCAHEGCDKPHCEAVTYSCRCRRSHLMFCKHHTVIAVAWGPAWCDTCCNFTQLDRYRQA